MLKIYPLAQTPDAPQPSIPKSWSYTAVRHFKACPQRWALSRRQVAIFDDKPLPPLLNVSAVEGTLLHELLKAWSHVPPDKRSEFRPRKRLQDLVREMPKRYESNPRINAKVLALKVNLDEVVRKFNQLNGGVVFRPNQTRLSPQGQKIDQKYGCEIEVHDPKSKLWGRLDYVDENGLDDFKTGEPSEDYHEQIRFYGAIWMAKWGAPPAKLTIVYTRHNESISFTNGGLLQLLETLRFEVATFDQKIARNELAANPGIETCAKCPVRVMCDQYWNRIYPETIRIKLSEEHSFTEYKPTKEAKFETNNLGVMIRDKVDGIETSLLLPSSGIKALVPESLRLLNLGMRRKGDRAQLLVNDFTEIFVEDALPADVADAVS